MDSAKRFEKLTRDFFRDWVHRHPLLGTALGFHDEFDDKMPDGSLEKELADHKFLHHALSEFEKTDPRKLAPVQAVERDAAIHMIRNWIFDREELRMWESSPEAPHVLGQSIFQVLSRNYAPLQQRMRAIMKRLEKMPKYIDQSRSRLRTPSKVFVEIELETITRLPGFFNLLKDIGREHMPATPQRDLNRLIDQAQNALERYSDWLIVDILPDCRDGFAIGEEKFKKLLQARGVDLSPGQLVSHAEADIARLKERQKEVGRVIKRKVPIEDIRDMIKQQHSESFDGALRFVRDAVGKSRQFVNRSKFVALPEGEQLYVIETPSFLRHFLPFGGYWPPARFEGRLDGYYFVTPGDCDSDKLKEHNYPSLTTMSLREGYPGRHVQMTWMIRHPSPLRTLADSNPASAGWGLYCEERAKEMGYDDTPPSRFMQLQAAVMAGVRVLLEARLASGKMTYEEGVETLIDYLGTDRICAEAELRRFVTRPGDATVQFWAREKLKDLRKWARDRMGPRFSETFFHTSFLQSGPIPIPLAKRELDLKISDELSRPLDRPEEKKGHHPPAKPHPAPVKGQPPARPAPPPKNKKARPAPPRRPAKKRRR